MIELTRGNLLEANAEALVNTVNTAGAMGKGIALQFKLAYPANYEAYRKACDRKQVRPGRMFVFETDQLCPRFIINFPTKRHWRGKARIEDIERGLDALVDEVQRRRLRSIAVPPLGCGNGGLEWAEVRPRIEAALSRLADVQVFLFEPAGAPSPDAQKVATSRPAMSPGRAALLAILDRYIHDPSEVLGLLEVQKLAYFVEAAGEPLSLRFSAGKYGPYSEVLNHVLQRMEGHFLKGYGDRSATAEIRLDDQALEEAAVWLRKHPETAARIERVTRAIEGFEDPYGLELLASVHWIAAADASAASDPGRCWEQLSEWSARKRTIFDERTVGLAWERLREQEMLPS